MGEYYRTGSFLRLSAAFVEQITKKYHYNENDADIIKKVVSDIRGCIKDQEGLELSYKGDYVDAAFTLGSRVDLLLERYGKERLALEEFSAEHILSELMLEEYAEIAKHIEEKTGRYIGAFHFWGAEEEYPLEKLEEQVENLEHLKLDCTPQYQLLPSKSVVFRVELSTEEYAGKDGKGHSPKVDVCANCMLGKTGNCETFKE